MLVLHHGRLLQEGTPADLLETTGKATLADAFIALTDGSPGGEKPESAAGGRS